MAQDLSRAKVTKTEPLELSDAKWTRLVKITYHDATGKSRNWEAAERSTRPENSESDGVGIIALLDKGNGKELLLQKQFRPPVNKVVIEVPAGLIDPKESPAECAVRELKEETGYVGTVSGGESGVSPVMFNDPGFCNTNLNMVFVDIDLSKPENQNLKPELEESEFIEVFTILLKNLFEECKKLEKEGYAIDARVGTLAQGIELAKSIL